MHRVACCWVATAVRFARTACACSTDMAGPDGPILARSSPYVAHYWPLQDDTLALVRFLLSVLKNNPGSNVTVMLQVCLTASLLFVQGSGPCP